MRLIRVAILECDEPLGETKKVYGSFSKLFHELLEAGASQLKDDRLYECVKLELSSYDVVTKQEYPEKDKIDAILLTGSRKCICDWHSRGCDMSAELIVRLITGYDSFTNGERNWISTLVSFVRNVFEHHSRVKLIGVCFGHQIIGRALGIMPVRNAKGWEVGVTSIELTQRGKALLNLESIVGLSIPGQ